MTGTNEINGADGEITAKEKKLVSSCVQGLRESCGLRR